MPDPLKLFISYRSSDAPKVDKIANDLALLTHDDGTLCYKPWQDKKNLPPAVPHWWDAIVDAIDASAVFVFHISLESLKSKVCQAELEYAHRRNRPIIPIVLEGEFFLDKKSGKYDLPKDTWPHVPEWLAERQFLFYTGAEFYQKFEMAIDVFRGNWPRIIPAPRPLHPDLANQATNHERYDHACDFAERLAFAEAEKLFDALVRRNDLDYERIAAEWLELLRLYAELIDVESRPRAARARFKPLWNKYLTLFPKEFWDGVFDPRGFAALVAPPKVPKPRRKPSAPKSMTAEEYYERGNDFYNKGKYDRAIADFTQAIYLNPQGDSAYNNRGASYYAKEDYDRAIGDFSEAIRLSPQYAASYANRAISYASKGEYERAIADYTEMIRLNPQDALTYRNRGNSYEANGEYERAIADYSEAIHLNPQDVDAYIGLGNSYYAKKDYDQAIAHYNKAIHLNPLHTSAYTNRQQAVEARTSQVSVSPDPESMTAHEYFNRAREYWEQWRWDEAIADYSEAIRLNPQYASAYFNRGTTYMAKGEYERAIADYSQVLKIAPNHPHAANSRKEAVEMKARQKK